MSHYSFGIPGRRVHRSRRSRSMFGSNRGSSFKLRILIAAAIALFAVVSYYVQPGDENLVTGEKERVALPDESQEMALGREAAPQMIAQHGGISRNPEEVALVERVGNRLVRALEEDLARQGRQNPYQFEFHLLADPQTINAFALPGGQIFITQALFREFQTEGQLAGVLGHEIGHVIERHANERMAKQQMLGGLAAAGGVAGGDIQSMQMSQAIVQLVSMRYGRDDELESDRWGVVLTTMAGYDPRAMIAVMEILDRASQGNAPPEFFSTHPKPANRVKYIEEVIAMQFPEGVSPDLIP